MVVWLVVAGWVLIGSVIGWKAMNMVPEEDRETYLFVGLLIFWPMFAFVGIGVAVWKGFDAAWSFLDKRWG